MTSKLAGRLRTRRVRWMTAAALGASAVTGIATALAAAGPASGATHAARAAQDRPLNAANDTYSTGATGTLAVSARKGVLANDSGGDLQIVSHTAPGHGSLTLNPDGSFNYVPQAGFTGDDTFTYTVSNAVHLYSTHLPRWAIAAA